MTLDYFAAVAEDGATTFDWSTGSETANAGFNLYTLVDGEISRLNDQLMPLKVVDSTAPQDYNFSVDDVEGTTFEHRGCPRARGVVCTADPNGEVYGACAKRRFSSIGRPSAASMKRWLVKEKYARRRRGPG